MVRVIPKYFILSWMAIINKSTNNKCWRVWRKWNTFALLVGMQIGVATMEISMAISQKIKNGISLWLSNATSGNLSEEIQSTHLKEHKHPYTHCRVIYNHQCIESAQVSICRWVGKTTLGHLHNGILPGHKKEENFALWDSMDGPGEHYTKWSKPVRERQIPYDLTHLWNLMNTLT